MPSWRSMAARRGIEPQRHREHGGETVMSATAERERVWYSPAVRVLSAQLGIDPATVKGTGRNGRVTRNDMLAAAGSGQQEAGSVEAGRQTPGLPAPSPAPPPPSPRFSPPPPPRPLKAG